MKEKAHLMVCDLEIKSVKEDSPEFYIVEGYASVYGNIDSYRDIVMPGAFAKDLLENGNERPILWQHKSDKPVGIGVFEERQEGLFVTMKLPKASDFISKEVMPLVKCGAVKGLSIGYWTVIEEYDREQRVNRLKECKLRENSIVTFPANSSAQITAAKHILGIDENEESDTIQFTDFPMAKDTESWDEETANAQIKKHTDSEKEISKQYAKCFLFADSEKSEYKFPYVKYIDNAFRIVPEAIYGVAAKLAGGTISNMSEYELGSLKSIVNSIYKKMGQEEPFGVPGKVFVGSSTLKSMSKKEILAILGESDIILSTNAKEMIANALRSQESEGSVTDSSKNILDAVKSLNDIL